ncbi:kinesin-domain-containing protein [Gigaspora margarita]|uniref:Kinesin-domain-containing protein n=1 Tax=Gigaspora margarita TaxID=4874 RepID=A0A8H4ACV1_GIGMA|nr:kinesin-domain-containing protein [Gigaspora margarita]
MENVTQSGKKEANSTYSTPLRSRQVGISETTPKKKRPVNKDLPVPPDRTPTSALRRGILKPISDVSSNKTILNVPSVTFSESRPKKRDHNSGLIKAYLRIRPINSEDVIKPYIQIINDTEVVMIPPKDSHAFKACNKGPEKYMFTKVFNERTSQKRFFLETTLPLVKGVLNGTNGLVFAYGVTNSGKTYSIQGTRNEEGILPRTLDTIFNSIKNLESEAQIKPVRYNEVENYNGNETSVPPIIISKSHMENPFVLSDSNSSSNKNNSAEIEDSDALDLTHKLDNIVVDVDEQFRYAVWVSYVEIYNEKIYDLLEDPGSAKQPESKRKALIVKNDKRTGNKYLSDIKEVRIRNVEEGYAVLKQGMKNRQIFSTLANETSSRSHCIFMIKVIKIPHDKDNATELSSSFVVTSRLSIVDLAGSERTKNVQTTGTRLKEAGNINRSLMVLGQCLEILRANQTRPKGQKHILVPYRHSKLTELFQSSFADGESVMIVNINPVDTGFDENMQVMKFSAVAKDVCTSLKNISSHYGYRSTLLFTPNKIGKENKTCNSSDSKSEDNYDPLINMLFAQIEELREKWINAEMRCGNLKLEIREQVSDEIAVHMSNMGKKCMDQQILTESMERQMEVRRDTPSTIHSGASYYHFSSNLINKLQTEMQELENEVEKLENKLRICASLLNDKDAFIEKLQFENKELERQILYIAQKLDYVDIETEDDSNLTDQELNSMKINNPSEETSLKEIENYNYLSPKKQEYDDRVGIPLFEDNYWLYDIVEECDEEVNQKHTLDGTLDEINSQKEETTLKEVENYNYITPTKQGCDDRVGIPLFEDNDLYDIVEECDEEVNQKRTLDEVNSQKEETTLKEIENYNYLSPTKQGCDDRLCALNIDDIVEECDEEANQKRTLDEINSQKEEITLKEVENYNYLSPTKQGCDDRVGISLFEDNDDIVEECDEEVNQKRTLDEINSQKGEDAPRKRSTLNIDDIVEECEEVNQKRTLDEINSQKGEDEPRKRRKLRNKKTYFETEIEENLNKVSPPKMKLISNRKSFRRY